MWIYCPPIASSRREKGREWKRAKMEERKFGRPVPVVFALNSN